MSRALSPGLTATLQRQEMQDQLLFFLTLSHPGLNPPIRVVRDAATVAGAAMTYQWAGAAWQAFPFEINWLTDNESAPEARLTVQNVDRVIGQAVDALTTAPEVRVDLMLASDFDLSVNPRVPVGPGDPEPEASAIGLFLIDIDVSASTVSGRLVSWDYTQEVYPNVRATPERCPGLWW